MPCTSAHHDADRVVWLRPAATKRVRLSRTALPSLRPAATIFFWVSSIALHLLPGIVSNVLPITQRQPMLCQPKCIHKCLGNLVIYSRKTYGIYAQSCVHWLANFWARKVCRTRLTVSVKLGSGTPTMSAVQS